MRTMKAWSRAGQSTLEYILIIAVVLVALIAASSFMSQGVNNTVAESSNAMQAAAAKLVPELGLP